MARIGLYFIGKPEQRKGRGAVHTVFSPQEPLAVKKLLPRNLYDAAGKYGIDLLAPPGFARERREAVFWGDRMGRRG